MEATAAVEQPPTTDVLNRGQRRRPTRRGRGKGNNSSATLSFRPASIVPEASSSDATPSRDDTVDLMARSVEPSSRGRGRDRGRWNVARSTQERTVNGRQFGGQLTRQDTHAGSDSGLDPHVTSGLQGDAAAFVPGHKHIPDSRDAHKKPRTAAPGQQRRRASKSQAPDVATRTHEDIDNGYYECPICTNEVRRNSKVWSCHTCWSVFHLSCIKKWAANEGSVAAQQNSEDGVDSSHGRQWRCPGCNLPKTGLPQNYTCWCEKETEPRPLPGLPPHSCGNTCSKDRRCPHPCSLTCHAGPCPPCGFMGPPQICFCGKNESTQRCTDTNYDTGWSCGEICGEVMPCGEHSCRTPCHQGLCGSCTVPMPAKCYCGHVGKEVLCDDRGESKESQQLRFNVMTPDNVQKGDHTDGSSVYLDSALETWTGSFNCGNLCGRTFDCGEHSCERKCHSQSAESEHCPRSPDVVSHCPCGKTPLAHLDKSPRENCTDSISRCKQSCGKLLQCGHACELLCHSGECSTCTKMVDINCRCGRTTSKTICHQGREEPPQCARTCKALLNCGRHACLENCCPGDRKAIERQSAKRKQRPLGSASRPLVDDIEAEHICTQQCGRLLKCGNHFCEELCHKGPCNTCREAIFDEISCHCGRTVLQPPLPCGTQPPPCRYPCTRQKSCNHPQVGHNCHGDDVSCPKCPYLVQKRCMCGKKTLKNQPCHLADVRCGEVCGKSLRCGSHSCRKDCHRPGECEDANGQPCLQPCGKVKKACGHFDLENTCHAPFPCKEDKACQSKIYITCNCQAQKQEVRCGASKTNEGNGTKTLPCNDECARLERNRKLALALNIDQSTRVDGGDHIPYSTDTLNLFAENIKWAQDQEREFRVFANSADEKRLRFKPMRSQQRAFIHALAEDFGLDSEGMDPEPHRHVMIWKTPRFVSAPNKTLADALRIRQTQRAANVSANVSDAEDQGKKLAKRPVSIEPFNGFVISRPRFGLTIDELRTGINTLSRTDLPVTFDIEFLPNEEIVLKAVSRTLDGTDLQETLQRVEEHVVSETSSKGFGSIELCAIDSSLNVLRRKSDGDKNSEGWSKVAAKKATPRLVVTSGGFTGNNAFSVLGGNKMTFAKKKPEKIKAKEEAVVDDWEAAELAEEEKERLASRLSGEEDRIASPADANETNASADDPSAVRETAYAASEVA